jgi:streptogramin lyase
MVMMSSKMLLMCLTVVSVAAASFRTPATVKTVAGRRVVGELKPSNIGARTDWVTSMFEDRLNSKYWILTPHEAARLDQRKRRDFLTRYRDIGLQDFEKLVMAQGGDGAMWLARRGQWWPSSRSDIFRLEGVWWRRALPQEIGVPMELSGYSPLRTIVTAENAQLWFVYADNLVAFDGAKWSKAVKLPAVSGGRLLVSSGAADRAGYIWLAGQNCILRYSPSERGFSEIRRPDGLQADIIIVFADHQGGIWFGDRSGRLAVYSSDKDTWTIYDLVTQMSTPRSNSSDDASPNRLSLNAVCEDDAGGIYVGTNEGLMVLNEKTQKWDVYTDSTGALPSRNITSIMTDSADRIWIGSSQGIVILAK